MYLLELIIILLCVFTATPLVRYIKYIDEENGCSLCDRKDQCVAWKPVFNGKSNFLSEFMLLSFLSTHGKCKEEKIKLREYCMYIIAGMVLVTILFWSKGQITYIWLYIISVGMLYALSIVDWYTQYIPIEYTVVIFLCGLIHLFADYSNWLQYLIGLIAVSGFLYVVNLVATPIIRKRYEDDEIYSVIGDGDIKLMAATGLLLGWKLNFLALAIGCVMGSVMHLILMRIKESGRQFAFGPYLSLGVYITMICGEQLVSWYLSMLGM